MYRDRTAAAFLAPAFLIIVIFLGLPILSSFVTSLHVDDQTLRIREYTGLGNYRELLGDETARQTIVFTFAFVFVSVTLEILVGLILALFLHEAYRGRGLVRAAVLIPWAVPTVVAATLWKYLLNDQYGMINLTLFGAELGEYRAWLGEPFTARASIILADVWKTSAFPALLLLAGLQAIPDELHEAARVDGAGTIQRFFRVTLPLLRPAILVAVLFRTMDAFRVFDLVFVMTEGGPFNSTNVLQFYGYKQMFGEGQFGYGSAVAVVVFLLIAVFSVGLVRIVGTRLLER